ncbi:phage tail spike protein [Streptococcus ruminantium]|uniref:phage tail spike protein n=1 Tax=Streptococcus ruminantium TaxID=1917441 RepID=UPI001D13F3C1|nr:phage tail spike protein [Streptococcus ruminantium]
MLYLLDKNVKTVKWNGIPLHEASSAIVKEETNGDFYITVRYPITDSGIYQLIKEDMMIKAPAPVLGAQLFRIKKPVENDDSLDITAYHISDDIMKRSINPVSVVGQSCAMALSQMVQNAKTGLGDFSFTSDIMDNRTFNTTETETLYSVLMDGKHSIVGTWEGELVRDNFALSIKRSRGADRGVVITTHKNLKSYQRTKNSQGVVTRIHARSTFKPDGAEDEVTLRVTVDSPLINSYPYINEKEYENNNAETVEDLRKWAEAKFKNEGIDKISDAIEIEAYELDGQTIHLGDTVNLKSRKHSADLYKKAIAYEFNALTEEYISITFDDKPGVGGSGVSSGLSNAADAILGASATAQDVAVQRAVKNANAAFDAEFDKRVEKIYDGIEQSKADAEVYADAIKEEIVGQMAESDRQYQAQKMVQNAQIAEILEQSSTAKKLIEEAKSELDQSKSDLTELVNTAAAKASQAEESIGLLRSEMSGRNSSIESNLAGITERFGNLQIGATNLFSLSGATKGFYKFTKGESIASARYAHGEPLAVDSSATYILQTWSKSINDFSWIGAIQLDSEGQFLENSYLTIYPTKTSLYFKRDISILPKAKYIQFSFSDDVFGEDPNLKVQFEKGTIPTDYHLPDIDLQSQVAAYKRTAEENSAELTRQLRVLDGKTEQYKTAVEQTANSLRTRLESLETYQSDEGKRVNQYFTAMREETARQIVAERTAVANGYVSKSKYEEDVRGITHRFESLRKGARNYAEDYDFSRGLWEYSQGDSSSKNVNFSNGIYTVSGTTKVWKQLQIHSESGARLGGKKDSTALLELKAGELYTLSVEAKCNSGNPNFWLEVRDNGLADYEHVVTHIGGARETLTASNEWVRYSISGVFKPNSDFGHRRIILGYSEIGSLSFRKVELTKGEGDIDAGPAPEDTDSKIAEFKQTIEGRFAILQTEKADQVAFQKVQETVNLYQRVLGDGTAVSETIQTAKGLVTRVSNLTDGQNLVYDPTNYSKYRARPGGAQLAMIGTDEYKMIRITRTGVTTHVWGGFQMPLHSQKFIKGEKLSYRINLWVDTVPDDVFGVEIKSGSSIAGFSIQLTKTGNNQIYTGTFTVSRTVTTTDDFGLHVWLRKNGSVAIGQISIVRGEVPPTSFMDNTSAMQLATETQVSALAGSWAVQHISSAGDILAQANLSPAQFLLEASKIRLKGKTLADEIQAIDGKFNKLFVADGTFGKLNANVIGANSITGDKMVVDQSFINKFAANEAYLKQLFAKSAFITSVQSVKISASQITGGLLRATNGAAEFNLNAGQILYYTDQAALKRILSGYPTQFVKFATGLVDGKKVGVTVIGSNRYGTESSNDGGFVGTRAWNGDGVDILDLVGDEVRIASAAYEAADGWSVSTLPGKLEIDAYRTSDRVSSRVKVGDVWLWGNATTYSSLKETLNLIIDNLALIHANKTTENSYSYTLPSKV